MDNLTRINNCEHVKTILEKNGFVIAVYRVDPAILLPDNTSTRQLYIKGYSLPSHAGIRYDFTGKFEKYAKNNSWTFAASTFEEVVPTNADATLAYLKTLSGVGKKRASDLFKAFGLDIFHVMENEPEKLYSVKGFKAKAVEKMLLDYTKRKSARKLFQFLYKYRIPESKIMQLHTILGPQSLQIIQEDPFVMYDLLGLGFRTVDSIRSDLNLPLEFKPRLLAGLIEVLRQAEYGGELFDKRSPFPEFMYDAFLPEPLYRLAFNDKELYKTSGTYLPENVCYLMYIKLLCLPISFRDFRGMASELSKERKVFVRKYGNEMIYYRWPTARAEFQAAKKIADLLYLNEQMDEEKKTQACDQITKALSIVERKLQMKLSFEQEAAVKMSLMNKVSVITGGPGTGKTSVEKGIIKCHKILHPNEDILLIAPTGRAAKRMSESTGAPASTIHRALGLRQGSDGEMMPYDETEILPQTLIIVDEASMIGAFLLNTLLQHVSSRARIIFIGDVDQLPSIEIGAVLREIIASRVPVARLTQTFRQECGSNIIVNAARINTGEQRLVFADDFHLIKASGMQMQETVVATYLELLRKYSDDEIVVLSPFRKRTETGTNNLNIKLREIMRPDITSSTPFFDRNGIRFFQGDKVMFTRNTAELTNGDIGTITAVVKTVDGIVVKCNFNDEEIELSDEDLFFLDLAYALTVHKSQGSEYKVVVVVCDTRHKVLLKRNLIYTAVTRAKEKLILIGEQDALNYAIRNEDSIHRRTLLGFLINNYCLQHEIEKSKEQKEKTKDGIQIKMQL